MEPLAWVVLFWSPYAGRGGGEGHIFDSFGHFALNGQQRPQQWHMARLRHSCLGLWCVTS